MMARQYHGPRFTAGQREKLKVLAWDMRQTGMTMQTIAEELQVSHTTVFYWLAAEKRRRANE